MAGPIVLQKIKDMAGMRDVLIPYPLIAAHLA